VTKVRIAWRPLDRWPPRHPPTAPHDRLTGAAFKSSTAQTMNELEDELTKIGAVDAVCEVDVDARDLRMNGEPRLTSRTRGNTPGVVLHFTNRDGADVVMPCDRYSSWQANVRALMLTLRALRAVDRYGATTSGEQYRGWLALPAAGFTTPTLSTTQAAELVSTWSGQPTFWTADAIKENARTARDAFRLAMKRAHPDNGNGGSNQKFTLVQEAGRILSAHHGVAKL
jgi:hypothetical protein